MELRNCSRCGQAFVYTGSGLCPDCREEDDSDFAIVRELLSSGKDYSLTEISEESGVPEEKIMEFIRQGRLQTENVRGRVQLECASCGMKIENGRLCDECAEGLRKQSRGEKKRDAEGRFPREKGRMHIGDRFRRRRR